MPSYADPKMFAYRWCYHRPAAVAGIVSGDILTQIETAKSPEVYSYMDCLAN
jgi:hypothetical protein